MLKGIRSAVITSCLLLAISGLCACATVSVNINADANVKGSSQATEPEAATDESGGRGDVDEENTEDNNEITETEEKVTRGDIPDYSFTDLYLEEVEKLNDSGDADQFALVDIDGDNIPELIAVSSEGSWEKDQIFLYTVYDGELVLLLSDVAPGIDGHYIAFNQIDNIIEWSGSAIGERHDYYELKEGELNPLFSIECFPDMESDDEDAMLYYTDGEETDEAGYQKAEEKVVKNFDKMIRLDVENMTIISLDYEDGFRQVEEEDQMPYMTYEDIVDEFE